MVGGRVLMEPKVRVYVKVCARVCPRTAVAHLRIHAIMVPFKIDLRPNKICIIPHDRDHSRFVLRDI